MASKNIMRPDEINERWKSVNLISSSDAEIEELVIDAYKTKRNINLPIPFLPNKITRLFAEFHCRHCGKCCTGGAEGIFLYSDDIERLSTAMQMSKRQLKDKFTFVSEGSRLLPFPCPFYDSDSQICKVYEFRPHNCRIFPFFASKDQTAAKRLYPSTSKARMITIVSRCPEGRRIACEILKRQRDAIASYKIGQRKS